MTSQSRTPKVGRNDPCPCGSGLKYKRCCEGKKAKEADESFWGRYALYLVIGAVLLGVAGFVGAMVLRGDQQASSAPGRVWSEAHGHWHNTGGAGGGRPCP